MKDKYKIPRERRDISYFKVRIMSNLLETLEHTSSMCLFQLRSEENVTPKCL